MVKGIVDSPDSLVEKFGIGRRLAIRIGALTGLGVQVTSAVLEEAARKPEAVEALVSDELFAAAGAGLAALEAFVRKNPRFALAEEDSVRVIALSEEILAERALPPALRRKAQMVVSGGKDRQRYLPFLNELLLAGGANEDIRSWKLRFLTAGVVEDRIEALRRILVFDLEPGEKASILFYALRDEDHRILSEAVKAFRQIGLSAGVADHLIRLVRGDPKSREDALSRLQHEAVRVSQPESDVIIAVAGRLIRDDEMSPLKAGLLRLMRSLLRGREGSNEDIQEMVRLLLRNVPIDQDDAQITLREILLSVGKGKSNALSVALWDEVESTGFGAHRTMLLSLIGRIENRKTGLEKLDGLLLDSEIPQALERGHDLSNFRFVLARRYSTLFTPLLETASALPEERRAAVFRALGEILPEVETAHSTLVHRVKALVTLAERSGKTVRRVLMRCRLHALEGLPPGHLKRLAELYVTLLEPEFLPEHNQEIWNAMREIGWTAAPVLADLVAAEGNDVRIRRESIALLQELLVDHGKFPAAREVVEKMLKRFERLSADPGFTMKPDVAPLLGAGLLNPAISRKTSSAIALRLVRRLKSGYSPGDVAAMAFVALSGRVEPGLKGRMVRRLIKILDEGDDAKVSTVTPGEDCSLMEIGEGTGIQTQQIPGALEALKNAALALAADDPGSAYMIARTLMRKWDDVMSWRRIWSSGARDNLVDALGEIALSRSINSALAAEVFVFLVQRFLAEPFHYRLAFAVAVPLNAGRFDNASGLSAKVFRKLLDTAEDPESTGPDVAAKFLLAAALVAAAPGAPGREGADKTLCVRLVDLLEKRSSLCLKDDQTAIGILAAAESLPPKIRTRAQAVEQLYQRRVAPNLAGEGA